VNDPENPKFVVQRMGGSERRQHQRWSVNVAVRELGPEDHIWRVSSLGPGGLFCPDAPPRLVGEELLVEIDLGSADFITRARVVHGGTGHMGMGVGLEFLNPQPTLASFLGV